MWPVTDTYQATVAGTHRARARAELWRDGRLQVTLTATSGSVSVDAGRATRRTVTATLLDPTGSLTPNDATDLLSPAGTQLKAYRGVVLPNGTVEEVPVGVFRLIDPAVDVDGGAVTITVSGQDEAATVAANRLINGWTMPIGTPVGTALAAWLTDRHPTLQVLDQAPTLRLGANWTPATGAESDPWGEAVTLASAHSLDLNIDPTGVCVIRPIPTPTAPAVVFTTGPTNTATRIRRALSAENTYSGVVVRGEPATGPPVQAEAWDTNPTSPTYYKGRFGARPFFITNQLIRTVAQAEQSAAYNLTRKTGILESVDIDAICNPALDVFDTITVTDPDLKLDAARLTIEQLTIPLTIDTPMTITARSRSLPTQAMS